MKIQVKFRIQDLWIGAYWERQTFIQNLWICIVPCFPIHLSWSVEVEETVKMLKKANPRVELPWFVWKQRAKMQIEAYNKLKFKND